MTIATGRSSCKIPSYPVHLTSKWPTTMHRNHRPRSSPCSWRSPNSINRPSSTVRQFCSPSWTCGWNSPSCLARTSRWPTRAWSTIGTSEWSKPFLRFHHNPSPLSQEAQHRLRNVSRVLDNHLCREEAGPWHDKRTDDQLWTARFAKGRLMGNSTSISGQRETNKTYVSTS